MRGLNYKIFAALERDGVVLCVVSMLQHVLQIAKTVSARARNPLGVLTGVFMFSCSMAAVVLTLGPLNQTLQGVLVVFLVAFPIFVFSVLVYLTSFHHTKFYSPQDFREEAHFLALGQQICSTPSEPAGDTSKSASDAPDQPLCESVCAYLASSRGPPDDRISPAFRGESVLGDDFCMHSVSSSANPPTPGLYMTLDNDIYCVAKDFTVLMVCPATGSLEPVSHLPKDARQFRGWRINRDVDHAAELAENVVEASPWDEEPLTLKRVEVSNGNADLRPTQLGTKKRRRR